MIKKVLVASNNPVKIQATKKGFFQMFPHQPYDFAGKGVSSEVADQPTGIEETLKGAENRVKNLIHADPGADLYVGIEGGIQQIKDDWFAFAWVVIQSKKGLTGRAQTGHFLLPPKIIELINQGYELGDANDKVFGKTNSKQKSGAVGIMTGDVIDRINYYEQAVVLALVPFKKPELF